MSLYRPKGTKVYTMDFMFHGQRVRETTRMTSLTRAREVERKRHQDLREGAAGIRRPDPPKLFATVAEDWVEAKKLKWSPRMLDIAENSMKHLTPVFGKRLPPDITPTLIAKYQRERLAEGASGRTINIEIGCLRGALKRIGAWERLRAHVEMLAEREDVGHALTAEEESALLAACLQSRSRQIHTFVVLAIETAARYGTIRRLQWKNVDFVNRCLGFGKDKTRAGSGRTIPLTSRALETLRFWAQSFPDRHPEHFVFPFEKCAASGADDVFGFVQGTVYDTDPTQPAGSIKKAWEQARKRAGLSRVRLHDLRHTGVSRMIVARIPLPMIAKIVGWSTSTLAKMSARYGHYGMDEMRAALESIGGPSAGVSPGYPQNSPQSDKPKPKEIQ